MCSLRFHDLTLCPFGLSARLVSALVRAAMSFEFIFNNTTDVTVVKWLFELGCEGLGRILRMGVVGGGVAVMVGGCMLG